MAARRAQFYHITRDAGVMSRLNAKRFAARGEGGQVSASEAAARANLQMEPEDRPPVMLEGLGTGSGDPCGPRWDVTDPQRYSLATPGGGMNRLNFLIQALNRLDDGFPRSRQQQEFHRAFIGACLNNIVGQIDLAANLSRLMEQFNLEEVRSDLIIYTARRMGKTMGVCLFAGAYLYTQPSCQISVYSPGHRASFKILGTVHRIVVFLAGGDDKRSIHRGNAETMQVFGTGEHASTLHAYPSDIRVSVPPQRPPSPAPSDQICIGCVLLEAAKRAHSRTQSQRIGFFCGPSVSGSCCSGHREFRYSANVWNAGQGALWIPPLSRMAPKGSENEVLSEGPTECWRMSTMRDFSSERMAVNRLAMITSAYGWCLSRINRDNVGILSLNVRRAW